MSGSAWQHMMPHGTLRRDINLGVNVSRRETSLVRRIDYAEGADKGRADTYNDPTRHKRQRRVNTGRIIDRKSGRDVLRRIIKLGMHIRYASMRSTGFRGFLVFPCERLSRRR